MSSITPWFPRGTQPVRDGVYITRGCNQYGPSDCWHAMRWHGQTRAWYSAGTDGDDQMNVIGWDRPNFQKFEWRGLAADPGEGA